MRKRTPKGPGKNPQVQEWAHQIYNMRPVRKRPRLNPVSEHEDTEGSVEIIDIELDISKGTAPSSET